jgi:hypothetical protein
MPHEHLRPQLNEEAWSCLENLGLGTQASKKQSKGEPRHGNVTAIQSTTLHQIAIFGPF